MKLRITTAILSLAIWASLASYGGLWSSEPATKWAFKKEVGRFCIQSDFAIGADETLIGELGEISAEVSNLLAIPASGQRIHVVLFSSAKEYGRYIKEYFPNVPERRALFIQHRGGLGMLFAHWHNDVRTDIRHEVVHGLLNDQSTPLPLWLDEGLAEYFEVVANDRMYKNPHMAKVIEGIRQNYVPTLSDLEQFSNIEHLGAEQYRDSWAWVHFLLHRKAETRHLLVEQLALYRSKQTVIPISRVIAAKLPNWRQEFTEHFMIASAHSR